MVIRKSPIQLILMILLYALPCFGQWVPEGEIIKDGTFPIFNEIIVQDGTEGTFVFWTDYRTGTSIIYGQKVDSAGYQLWQQQGAFVGYTTISFPSVAAIDGSGGAIVAWPNYRGTHTGIYAQRIGSDGQLIWPDTGLAIADWYGGQWQVAICSDGQGGAVLCWSGDSLGASRIITQRLDGNGNKLWGEYGVRLSQTDFDQLIPKITMAIDSSIYCVWNDERTVNGPGLYAQKLDLSGAVLWGNTARPLAEPLVGTIGTYAIAPDTNWGLYCIWNDGRPEGYDQRIYLQHINSNGSISWPQDGIELSQGTDNINPFIAIGDDFRAIISWDADISNKTYYNIINIVIVKHKLDFLLV